MMTDTTCKPGLDIGELPEVNTLSPGADVVLVEGQGDEAQALRIPALAFGGEKGEKGEVGPANMLSVGTVTTLPPGAPASASVTGTAPAQTLNLGLPQAVFSGPLGDLLCTGVANLGLRVGIDYSVGVFGQWGARFYIDPSANATVNGATVTIAGTNVTHINGNVLVNGRPAATVDDSRNAVENGVRRVSMGLATGKTLTADGKTYAQQLGDWQEGQQAPIPPASVFA